MLTGKENYYALVLLPLILFLFAATRLNRSEMGLRLGSAVSYLISLYYPIAVMGLATFIAFAAGYISLRSVANPDITNTKIVLGILLLFLVSLIFGLLTEEGFFRGWLWGILEKRCSTFRLKLIWTSLLFSIWHFKVTSLCHSFIIPMTYVPIYLGNVLLIGMLLGLLRQISGSIIVPLVCHALWNTIQYTLFGSGDEYAFLGISSYWIFDPERGLLGLVLNLFAVIFVWRWYNKEISEN